MLKAKILLVEDERIVALDIKRLLQSTGYNIVGVASTGEKAVRQAIATQPDLILMDIKLKGDMDGITAAAKIREQFDLPIIFLTAFSDETTLQRAKITSPYGYLLKPLNERELHTTIQTALYRHQAEAEVRQRNRELTLLNRVISASVTSSEPEEFLQITCHELIQAFDLSRAAALLFNATKSEVTVAAEDRLNGPITFIHKSFPIQSDFSLEAVLRKRIPVNIPDVCDEPMLDSNALLLQELGIASLLLLPLIVENEVIGFLALATAQLRDFLQNEIKLSRTVADQISAALGRIQLQKERSQLSAVIEQTAESVLITSAQGEIIYVNPAFEQITGYSRAEVIGGTPKILKSGQHSQEFYQGLWQTISAGQVWHGRLINKKRDGTLFTEDANITPIRDERGNVINYVAVKRDVTKELQLEEQYHQSQKMEAVGLLAGGIAHDFNNLLTTINGFAELLQMQLSPDTPHNELVDKILNAGQRAADLVRQLLAFSRKQIIKPRTVDLNMILDDTRKILDHIIGEHIEFKTIPSSNLGLIRSDPNQLEQIILNLAVNARDAMPDGGYLTMETANVQLGADDIAKHFEAEPGEYVMLAVSDTGMGMNEEIQARIFEPFFTTKEVGKGTGLGLATVFGIVKQNNGYIWVYSEEGHGTTFKIYFPRTAQSEPSPTQKHWTQPILQGNDTILLVEDEPDVCELVAEMLRNQGYYVLASTDGHEAIKLANQLNGTLDLLVTDVVMPGMNGKILAEKITEIHPGLKILFMSGYTGDMIARHGVLDDGAEFIGKPFDSAKLANKVHQVLNNTDTSDK